MKITVTGASGFIGQYLVPYLQEIGHDVTALSRKKSSVGSCKEIITSFENPEKIQIPPTDVFIHLAGLAHSKDNLDYNTYHAVNCTLPVQLAQIAAESGAGKFLFLSTAKIYGEETDQPFDQFSPFNPLDLYSESKANAEQALEKLSGPMNIVSIRPPVVYGPNPKANIASLFQACKNKSVLPLPLTENKRSFLSVNNLCDAILLVMNKKQSGFQGYLLDDGEAISTKKLVLSMAHTIGSQPRIIYVPNFVMSLTDSILQKTIGRPILKPLYANFEIDSSSFANDYNWQRPFDTESGIRAAFG